MVLIAMSVMTSAATRAKAVLVLLVSKIMSGSVESQIITLTAQTMVIKRFFQRMRFLQEGNAFGYWMAPLA